MRRDQTAIRRPAPSHNHLQTPTRTTTSATPSLPVMRQARDLRDLPRSRWSFSVDQSTIMYGGSCTGPGNLATAHYGCNSRPGAPNHPARHSTSTVPRRLAPPPKRAPSPW